MGWTRLQLGRPLLGAVLVVFAWLLLSASLGGLRTFLPWPWEVATRLLTALGSTTCWVDVGSTASRAVLGLTIGTALGVPCGIFLGLHTRWHEVLRVPIDFLRSIPVTALFPVAVLFWGI